VLSAYAKKTFFPLYFIISILVRRQEGHLACKKLGIGRSFAHVIAPVVTTTSVILSPNKIQNRDILVPAYPGCSEKWPLNKRRRHISMFNSY